MYPEKQEYNGEHHFTYFSVSGHWIEHELGFLVFSGLLFINDKDQLLPGRNTCNPNSDYRCKISADSVKC